VCLLLLLKTLKLSNDFFLGFFFLWNFHNQGQNFFGMAHCASIFSDFEDPGFWLSLINGYFGFLATFPSEIFNDELGTNLNLFKTITMGQKVQILEKC
jgi:hypothetical protein